MRSAVFMAWVGLALACGPRAPQAKAEPVEPSPVAPAREAPLEEEAAVPPLQLQEVAPGVFAALQPTPRRFVDSNAAVLVSEAGAVVIDGPQQVATARWLYSRLDGLTEGAQRDLVTTHWHLDHALGGSVLRRQLEAEGRTPRHWGHAGLASLLRNRGREQLDQHRAALSGWVERGEAMQASGTKADGTTLSAEEQGQLSQQLSGIREQHAVVESLELAVPTHPVVGPTRVELGSLAFELIPVVAHTDADLVVYVREAKVLITGDVLDELPFGGHGRPRRWLEVLRQLAQLDVEAIIPGHGPVMGREAFDRAIGLWSSVLEQAEHAVQQGQGAAQRYEQWSHTESFAALRETMTSDPVSGRAFDAFVPEALARAMAELRGELDGPRVPD